MVGRLGSMSYHCIPMLWKPKDPVLSDVGGGLSRIDDRNRSQDHCLP